MNEPTRSCPRCRTTELEAVPEPSGALRLTCPRCHGDFLEADDVERYFGGPLPEAHDVGLPNPFGERADAPRTCPLCRRDTLGPVSIGELDAGVCACAECGGHFFEASALAAVRRLVAAGGAHRISTLGLELDDTALRRSLPTPSRAPIESPMEALRNPLASARPFEPDPAPALGLTRHERAALLDTSDGLLGASRFRHDEPWSRLLTLPIAFVVASLLSATAFGRLLAMPFRIQFHELGHAIPAWLSGRIAVPLPCGFTFWREETSVLAHLLVLGFSATLAFHGLRERRYFGVAVAIGIELLHLVLGLLLSDSATMRFILLDGCAAELWLSGFVVLAFYFRAPDRFRWDFFRFLFVPPAMIALVDATRMWHAVETGSEQAPVGSILGTVGDGSGDLERLMDVHGLALSSIVRGYAALSTAVCALVLVVYLAHAAVAWRGLRTAEPSSP